MNHIKIVPFTASWWNGIIFAVVFIIFGILLTKTYLRSKSERVAFNLGFALLLEVVTVHLYLIFIQNTWSLQESLPAHLCRFSIIISSLALITHKQLFYEWAVYVGFPGGLHSLLTPELTQGNSIWMIFDYYYTHTMLLFVPVFMTFSIGKKPGKNAFLRALLYVNFLAVLIFPLNVVIGSNYMYLSKKPIADNPFLLGNWPWYILGLELVAFLHMLIMDIVFRVVPNYQLTKYLANNPIKPKK